MRFSSSSSVFLKYVVGSGFFFLAETAEPVQRCTACLRIYDDVKFTKHTEERAETVRADEPDPGLCCDRLDLTVLEHVKLNT